MIDGPWGARLPVTLRPPTTADDAFEDLAEAELRTLYPQLHIERTRAVQRTAPNGAADHYRPDLVVYLALAPEALVLLVADAKRRRDLEKRDVEKIADYRDNFRGGQAVIYVPDGCHVTAGAQQVAASRGIQIATRPW